MPTWDDMSMGNIEHTTSQSLALRSNDALLIERITESHRIYEDHIREARQRLTDASTTAALAHTTRVNDAIRDHARAIETLTADQDDNYDED